MAGSTETSRLNFNPDWMGPTSNPSGPARFSSSCAQQAADGGRSQNRDGVNLDTILAPPKLSKNRYGREELLALFTPAVVDTPPPRLKDDFPDFYVSGAQDPICMLPFTEVEQNLLMQGGINSSKVINVVNHPERQNQRWYQPQGGPVAAGGAGSPVNSINAGFLGGGGANPNFGGGGGGFNKGFGRGSGPERDQGSFVRPRGGGVQSSDTGGARYMGGGIGRGRGDLRSSANPRPVGGLTAEKEMPSQNTRAQGLYDPNNPRDRPRQRLKSTGRSEDVDDYQGTNQLNTSLSKEDAENPRSQQFNNNSNSNNNNNNINNGQNSRGASNYANFSAGPNVKSRHLSTSELIGSGQVNLPEWAKDDDPESLPPTAAGTFDATGNFRPADSSQRFSPTDTSSNADLKSKLSEKILEPILPNNKQRDKILETPKPVMAGERNNLDAEDGPAVKANQQQFASGGNSRRQPQTFGKSTSFDYQATDNAPPSLEAKASATASIMLQNPVQAVSCSGTVGESPSGGAFKEAPVGSAFQSSGSPLANKLNYLRGPLPSTAPHSASSAGFLQGQTQVRVSKSVSANSGPALLSGSRQPLGVESRGRRPTADDDLVLSNLHQQAENLVKSVFLDDNEQHAHNVKSNSVINSSERNSWYYKDPSGVCQGPFSTEVMSVWFGHGYFTMSLMVRRANESEFIPLGDLIKQCGQIPFVSNVAQNATPNLHNLSSAGVTQPSSYIPYQQETNKPQQFGGGAQTNQILKAYSSRPDLTSPISGSNHPAGDLMAPNLTMNNTSNVNNPNLPMSSLNPGLLQSNQAALMMPNPNLISSYMSGGGGSAASYQSSMAANNFGENFGSASAMTNNLTGAFTRRPLDPTGQNSKPKIWDVYNHSTDTINNPPPQLEKQTQNQIMQQQQLNQQLDPKSLQILIERLKDEEIKRQVEQEKKKLIELHEEEMKRRLEEEKRKIMALQENMKREKEEQERQFRESEERRRREELNQQKKWLEEKERCERIEQNERMKKNMAIMANQKSAWGIVSAEVIDEGPDQAKAQMEAAEKERKKTEEDLEERQFYEEIQKREAEEERQRATAEGKEKKKREKEAEKEKARLLEERERKKRDQEEERLKKLKELKDKENWELQLLEEENRRKIMAEREKALRRQQKAQDTSASMAAWMQFQPKSTEPQSLREIQMEEERQMMSERRQILEQEFLLKKEDQKALNITPQSGAWGSTNSAAAKSLNWEMPVQAVAVVAAVAAPASKPPVSQTSNSTSAKMAPWFSGAVSLNTTQSSESTNDGTEGFWDEDNAGLGSPLVAKKTDKKKPTPSKANQQANAKTKSQPKNNSNSNNTQKAAAPVSAANASVKRLFAAATPTDEFTVWCVKQVKRLNKEIDESEAAVFIEFLKDVPDLEVMDYVLGYIPDTQASKDFLKQYIDKRREQNLAKNNSPAASEWSTVKSQGSSNSNGGGTGASNQQNSNQQGAKKKNKKVSKRPVDNSILGFRSISDSNRVNAGEIDSPML